MGTPFFVFFLIFFPGLKICPLFSSYILPLYTADEYTCLLCSNEIHIVFFIFNKIQSLSVASFAIIFYHSIGCFFHFFFLMASFAVQKLLSLIRSHWCIFAFISIALETDLRKHLYG